MKEKFTETAHCLDKVHCEACRTREPWREKMKIAFEWDGECPHGITVDNIPKPPTTPTPKKPKEPPPPLPPLHIRLKNFAVSMKAVRKRYKKTGELMVTKKVQEDRFRVCKANVCKKFNDKSMACAACGCSFKAKLPLIEMECPLGYWQKG